jgi:hypothetical protein
LESSWRQISPKDSHCATVPDGSNGHWKAGEIERVEAKNRAALKAAEEAEIEANGYFTEPDWHEVISPDGVRCFVTCFRPAPVVQAQVALPPIPEDLTVPMFLRQMAA